MHDRADQIDPAQPGTRQVDRAELGAAEIDVLEHGSAQVGVSEVSHGPDANASCRWQGRPQDDFRAGASTASRAENAMMTDTWRTRLELSADIPAVRPSTSLPSRRPPKQTSSIHCGMTRPGSRVSRSYPPTSRARWPATLFTRCHIGEVPALCLAPCAVLPQCQRGGAGSTATRAALDAARGRGERYVTVLGRPASFSEVRFHASFRPRHRPEPRGSGRGVDGACPRRESAAAERDHPVRRTLRHLRFCHGHDRHHGRASGRASAAK